MKKLLLLLIVPFLGFGQNNKSYDNQIQEKIDYYNSFQYGVDSISVLLKPRKRIKPLGQKKVKANNNSLSPKVINTIRQAAVDTISKDKTINQPKSGIYFKDTSLKTEHGFNIGVNYITHSAPATDNIMKPLSGVDINLFTRTSSPSKSIRNRLELSHFKVAYFFNGEIKKSGNTIINCTSCTVDALQMYMGKLWEWEQKRLNNINLFIGISLGMDFLLLKDNDTGNRYLTLGFPFNKSVKYPILGAIIKFPFGFYQDVKLTSNPRDNQRTIFYEIGSDGFGFYRDGYAINIYFSLGYRF